MHTSPHINYAEQIKQWGQELGFDQIGITDTDLSDHEQYFFNWIQRGYHGNMDYLHKHGYKRTRPELLIPGTIRIIMARINYLPPDGSIVPVLADPTLGAISRYALGKDYHRVIRKRLAKLAQRMENAFGEFNYRVFADSGPVLEKALAAKAGLGWFGKHTILLNKTAGSYFFLGTIYTDLPLPIDSPVSNHCGRCTACIDVCPTQAIIAAGQLNASRCISYLTIEYKGIIPIEFRAQIGNRIFGCDDCQVVCPWNKFAQPSAEPAFQIRHGLDKPKLLDLFNWTEVEFLRYTEGSAIRRVGYECWIRNLAIALGNAPYAESIVAVLQQRWHTASRLVQIHIEWAIQQQLNK